MEDKNISEKLKLSEQRFNVATEIGGIGIWELNLEDDTSFRNLMHDKIFGYKEAVEDWGEQKALKHVIPDDQLIFKEAFSNAIKTNRLFFEVRVMWPDNTLHWISANGKVIRDNNNKPIKMIGVVTDVTDRKNVEIKLNDVIERLEKINRLMTGRELKMIELKAEIADLKKDTSKSLPK